MIPDPQNVFEALQNDVAAQLMITPPFDSIKFPDGSAFKVLTEDEGDIQFEFDAQIAQLGLAVVVHAPEGEINQPDMPGPLVTVLNFDVWVSEAPVFNQGPSGTQVRLFRATGKILAALHLFSPASVGSPVFARKWTRQRERTYISDADKVGTLIKSNVIRFSTSQVDSGAT